MSCRTMAQKINSVLEKRNEVDKKENIISVTYKTINNILKKYYGKPEKIGKLFFLSQKDMEKRFQFFKIILERKINYDQILITDESKISMGYYTHDFIRLDPEDYCWRHFFL